MYGSRRGMDRPDAKPTLGYAGHAPNKIPPVLADPAGTAAPKAETRLCAPSTVAALELEHALGFAPCLNALAYCPATVGGGVATSAASRIAGGFDDPTAPGPNATSVLYACGRLVICHDLDDLHEQRVLRSHDAPVTCVDASPAGTYLASGQRAAVDQRVYVNVWDAATLGVRHRLQTPHQGHAELVRFSSDEAMLATTGAEGGLCVWDCASGSLIASYRDTLNGDQARGLCWGEVRNPGARDQSYVLYVAFHTGVRVCTLTFSLKKLNFELDVRACVMPGAGGRMGGFTRRYTCCDVIGNDVLCGSTSGDVLIFQAGTGTYRNAVTVAAGGVSALLCCPEHNCVIVAGGDGGVRKMVQSPQSREWAVVKHISLPGGVVSMCRSLDEHQIIVSTTSGAMIRILTSDLSFAVAAQAPLGAITDLAIAEDAPEIFATASTDGVVRIWDLSTYSVRSTATATSGTQQQQQQPSQSNPAHAFRTSTAGGAGGNINNAMIAAPDGAPSAIVPTSIAFVPATRGAFAVAGWSDGRIRGIDFRHGATGVVQWSAPAHKGRVNSVQVTAQYILTSGSEDSAVRIWTLTTRELAGQMQDHKAPVAAAATDVTTDVIVHSCGADGVMCSYDISKTNPNPSVKSCQRVATHSYALGGPFTCIAQRRDHEREVIVGTHEGRVAFFDMDVADPVLVIEDKRRARVTCVSVSPTGQYLVVGSADGTLSLYELFSQDGGVCAPILQCACHSTGVARAQWAGDGRQVITGGTDGEVLVWNFFTMPKPGY